jgi:uroporphyrinogen decarboxylase
MNPLFRNALDKIPQNVPPVWMMRQAGRYHRHYQNLKKKYSFMQLCKEPELAAETALGPIMDFDFDVSILFSDLLFPLEALGMGLDYPEGVGPQLGWHLRSPEELKKLRSTDLAVEDLLFQKKALELTRQRLPQNKSLIGFVGGPWTLFTYAVQGKHDGNLIEAKTRLELFDLFVGNHLLPLLVKNIQLQLDGGAEVVMLFDTAAGELSPALFRNKVWPYLKQLASSFPNKLGYYSKHTTHHHYSDGQRTLWDAPWAGWGFDHKHDLRDYLKLSRRGFVQGNFDQSLLFCDNSTFKAHLKEYLKPFAELSLSERAGWVCGLGHGVLPKTPEQNVREFVQIVRSTFEK